MVSVLGRRHCLETSSNAAGILRVILPTISILLAGPVYKYDLSLPVAQIYDIVAEMRLRLQRHKEATVVAYGHLGDGNLHLNISVPKYSEEIASLIEPFVYEFTARHNGSISAEHGEMHINLKLNPRKGALQWAFLVPEIVSFKD